MLLDYLYLTEVLSGVKFLLGTSLVFVKFRLKNQISQNREFWLNSQEFCLFINFPELKSLYKGQKPLFSGRYGKMNLKTVKNWWNARKFWEKGIVLGILLSPINLIPLFFYSQLNYGSAPPQLTSFFGLEINTYLAVILLFFIFVFVAFGLGFRLSEYWESYVIRGSFIGAWISFVGIVIAVLSTNFESFQIISYIKQSAYNIFAGSLAGLLYERQRNAGKTKPQPKDEIIEPAKGEAKGWAGLRFWQKGTIFGFIIYLLILAVIAFGGEGVNVALSVAGWSFVLIVFGMFGLGFKIAERSKKYYMRGFIIGNSLPVPVILALLALEIITYRPQIGGGSFTGVLVVMLIIAMPILGGIGALIGYVYGRLVKGDGGNEIKRGKKTK